MPKGACKAYQMIGESPAVMPMSQDANRVFYSAAHVVADPYSDTDPSTVPAIDWEATMAFRRHLAGLGLGIAEAMDTAQRGMGARLGGGTGPHSTDQIGTAGCIGRQRCWNGSSVAT